MNYDDACSVCSMLVMVVIVVPTIIHVSIIPSFDHIIIIITNSSSSESCTVYNSLVLLRDTVHVVVLVVLHATLHCHDGIHHSTGCVY